MSRENHLPKKNFGFQVQTSLWQLPPRIFKGPLSLSSPTLNFVCGVALPSTPRRHDGMLLRPNPLPKWSPSAHVAQVEMSRGTLTCLIQTGECFLLTFDLGREDVNNKNSHGIGQFGQISHGSATEWINHGARPQKLRTTSWNVLLRQDNFQRPRHLPE